jgi:hypothetical protein
MLKLVLIGVHDYAVLLYWNNIFSSNFTRTYKANKHLGKVVKFRSHTCTDLGEINLPRNASNLISDGVR